MARIEVRLIHFFTTPAELRALADRMEEWQRRVEVEGEVEIQAWAESWEQGQTGVVFRLADAVGMDPVEVA